MRERQRQRDRQRETDGGRGGIYSKGLCPETGHKRNSETQAQD